MDNHDANILTYEVSFENCWHYRIDIQFYVMSPHKSILSIVNNYRKEEPFCEMMIWPVSIACGGLGFFCFTSHLFSLSTLIIKSTLKELCFIVLMKYQTYTCIL